MNNAEKFLKEFGNIDDEFLKEAMNYTMKKKFNFKPIIAVAACAAFIIAAVPVAKHFAGTLPGHMGGTTATTEAKLGASGKYTVLESAIHDSDSSLNATHKIEIEIDKSSKFFKDNKKINTEKSIEFAGKIWTGKYQNSVQSPYYSDDHDSYFGEKDGEEFLFTVYANGEIRSFSSSEMKKENTGKILTHDECYVIAAELLKEYNMENYTLKYSRYMDWRNGYYFEFRRTLDGIMTSEYVSVGIRDNGEVFSYTYHSKGAMDNLDVSAINMDAINIAIDEKVSSIYKNNDVLLCKEKSVILTKLADGSYIFDCEVEVEGKCSKYTEWSNEKCYLVITMD